ncbi:hypothetical protein GTP46_09525 [Duganella sp. FT135W]|uniref:Uncharacterized protein n=1 Tax=Duganella flavida TaxID=2692175 RepID=A0A6L8KAF8_9BURK|nr:hypothetical protein [Duganella flavida]MYM22882.1 hypothetical protein [Duganella flavida]
MSGKKRTPSERAIIYAGVLGGLSIQQIDELLQPLGAGRLNPNSYEMLKGTYFSSMVNGIGGISTDVLNPFGESIYHPKQMGDL